MNKNKAQITLFIIFGLIILFTIILVFYLANLKLAFKPSPIVPEDVKPVKNLIEQCLEDNAKPLIEDMKIHSGYFDLTQFVLPDSYFSDFKIPYSLPENRDKMAEFLKIKIENELQECIDFSKFPQFNIEEKSNLKLIVQINDEDVTLSLEYLLEIISKKNNKKTKLLDFKKVIPTKLGKLSDLAREIMNKENLGTLNPITNEKMHFLEEMTLDILRSDNLVFPYEGMELTTDKRQWSIKNDLKPDLKDALWANLDCITYQGTASSVLPASCDIADYHLYYQKFKIPVTTELKYKNTKVITSHTFTPEWKFTEFSVSPNKGDIIKPINPVGKSFDPMSMLVGSFIKLYHHRYNIKYPVLFTLYEGNEQFNFATQVIIKNNRADRTAKYFFTTTLITSDDFCEDKETEYTIEAIDEHIMKAIEDVNVQYQCVQFICDIGKTQPTLTEKFPFCHNGILIANKDNYLESAQIIEENSPKYIPIYMTPLIKLDYEFNIWDGPVRELEDDESIVVMLSNENKNYDAQIYYSNDIDKEEIELLLGTHEYDITVYLTKTHELTKEEKLIGGYKNKIEITTYDYFTKITFDILANSHLINEPDEVVADFWQNTVEVESKNYIPILTW